MGTPPDTLASRAYLQLRHDIVRGRLAAGSKLRLIDLTARCATYNLSGAATPLVFCPLARGEFT